MRVKHSLGYLWHLAKIIIELCCLLMCLKSGEANLKWDEYQGNSYKGYLEVMVQYEKYKQQRDKKTFLKRSKTRFSIVKSFSFKQNQVSSNRSSQRRKLKVKKEGKV